MELRTLLIEGLWYKQDNVLKVCRKDGDAIDVEESLKPMEGLSVLVSLHHLPPNPVEIDKWGGGCCHWEALGKCPAGHHSIPDKIFTLSGQGVLVKGENEWFFEKDGARTQIPLQFLEGHDARLVLVTTLKPTELVEKPITPDSVESLGFQISNLKDMLHQLQESFKKGS
jgi:hypothetical protein